MKTFIEYLILCIPLITHLIVDYKGTVNHKLNAFFVTALSVLVGLFLPGYFWQGALYAFIIHLVFFDPIYNVMRGHKLFYHGSSSNPNQALADKGWSLLPPHVEVFVRLWFLGVGIGVYYYLELIIG